MAFQALQIIVLVVFGTAGQPIGMHVIPLSVNIALNNRLFLSMTSRKMFFVVLILYIKQVYVKNECHKFLSNETNNCIYVYIYIYIS